jgi:hypothetical protein
MPTVDKDILEKHARLMLMLMQAKRDTMSAIKHRDLYGEFGVKLTQYATPYLWIVPAIAAIFLLIAFKRTRLNGPTQKCLICIIVLDVLFTMFTGIRDGILSILKLNYGFVEYKICWLLLISLRIQSAINSTSVWIKSGMLIHQAILFLFPFKMRIWNLKYIFIFLILFHSTITIAYCLALYSAPIKGIPMIQEFVMGLPLKRIDACAIDQDHIFFKDPFHSVTHKIGIVVQFGYLTALPIFLHCISTAMLAFCIRKEIKKVALMRINYVNNKSKNVKYLTLMKINIILGISFIVQECPMFWSFIHMSSTSSYSDIANMQSMVHIYSAVVFAIGKPLDVIIYASLSVAVRKEFLKLLRCR